jgi:hypothetical protein
MSHQLGPLQVFQLDRQGSCGPGNPLADRHQLYQDGCDCRKFQPKVVLEVLGSLGFFGFRQRQKTAEI